MSQSRFVEILATFGYLGKAPIAPGTVGTLGAVPLVIGLHLMGSYFYMGAAVILVVAAVFIAQAYEEKNDVHDAREIVIDEVAGYVIAMTWLPLTWQSLGLSFLLFRLLDGLKPFPINWLDRKIEGGMGVVLDDVAAGLITNVALQIVFTETDWLGYQLAV